MTETTRTVYLAAGTPEAPRARAVIARFGITDGVNTEVLSGLSEGDQVITNVITAEELAASGSSGRPAANPFGGGRQTPRRF